MGWTFPPLLNEKTLTIDEKNKETLGNNILFWKWRDCVVGVVTILGYLGLTGLSRLICRFNCTSCSIWSCLCDACGRNLPKVAAVNGRSLCSGCLFSVQYPNMVAWTPTVQSNTLKMLVLIAHVGGVKFGLHHASMYYWRFHCTKHKGGTSVIFSKMIESYIWYYQTLKLPWYLIILI